MQEMADLIYEIIQNHTTSVDLVTMSQRSAGRASHDTDLCESVNTHLGESAQYCQYESVLTWVSQRSTARVSM